MLRIIALALTLVVVPAVPARGQMNPAPTPEPGSPADDDEGVVPWALQSTLEALGASNGTPDGAGASWYPTQPVRGQQARMRLANYQIGLTTPLHVSDTNLWFGDGAIRALDVGTNAILPTSRVRVPTSLWDVQLGGGYVRQLADSWSWGTALNLGTASDRPFHSLAEATLSALVFLRKPQGNENAWLFYVVSTSTGQLGRNIPVPGAAYEFHEDLIHGVIGFPFFSVDYRPMQAIQFEVYYAALTEIQARASYHVTDHARLFAGFEWWNQSWFRANREHRSERLFWYEKRLEGGFGWTLSHRLDLRIQGGYAFDRFFVENHGLSFRGQNRVDLAPGPFATTQLELKF